MHHQGDYLVAPQSGESLCRHPERLDIGIRLVKEGDICIRHRIVVGGERNLCQPPDQNQNPPRVVEKQLQILVGSSIERRTVNKTSNFNERIINDGSVPRHYRLSLHRQNEFESISFWFSTFSRISGGSSSQACLRGSSLRQSQRPSSLFSAASSRSRNISLPSLCSCSFI